MNFPKLLPILLIHSFIFCLNTNYSNAKLSKETWQVFSDKNALEFRHSAADEYGRWVYIGAVNCIYQLSTDLELQINYTISELSPSDCTAPDCSQKLKRNTTTFNRNEVLVLDYQNQQLISCGTFFYGICHAHDISNISKIWTTRFEPIVEDDVRNPIVAFIGTSLPKNSSTPLSTLYVGFSTLLHSNLIQTMAITNLEREHTSSVLTQNTASHFTRNDCITQLFNGIIVYGFSLENVGYFIIKNPAQYRRAGGYLIAIDTHKNNSCNDVPISCVSGSDVTSAIAIEYAYIQNRNPDSGSKTGSHEMEEKIMFTIQSKYTKQIEIFSVCRYKINKLHSLFHKNETLIGDLVYSHPRDVQVTAMAVTSINNYTILFLGTFDGRLQKISIEGFDSSDLSTGIKYADLTIDAGSEVRSDMLFDSTMNFLYVMTKNKLTKVKIHDCDKYNTSQACLAIKDPYCGWCFPSNKCCLKSKCAVEQNPINWVSHSIDKYIDASSSPADKFSRTVQWNVTFKLITLHPFINHTVVCLFEFGNFSINTTTIRDKNTINCVTPTPHRLPPTPINNHSIGAELSVQTNYFPAFKKIHVIFYDCSTYKSCLSCMESPYPCKWYVNEFRCTDDAIWKKDDIIIGMNFSSTNFQELNGRLLLNDRNKYSKDSTFCPQFFTETKSDIYIRTPIEKTAHIKAHYKIPMGLPDDSLSCNLVSDSKEEKIQFELIQKDIFPGDGLIEGRFKCNGIFAYAESKPFITFQLRVLWNGSKPLDNTYNSHIVVYKCVHMGDQCTACLNNTNYSCMWNSETAECKYYDLDDKSNMTDPWLHDIQKCSNSNKSTNWLTKNISSIITLIVAVTFTVVAVFVIYYRRSAARSRKMQQQISKMGMEMIAMSQCVKRVVIENEIELDENESHILRLPNVNIVYEPLPTLSENETAPKNEYELLPDEKWEIPREKLVLGKSLGEGEFGKVVKGNVSGLLQQDIVTTVAVKMLKKKHSDIDMVNLVKEMELMKLIGRHDNVLGLLGCCTQDGPLLIITEYSTHGNLLDFLRKHNHHFSKAQKKTSIDLSEKVLITFAQHVAKGMEYLASMKCIHRDLAARNILVFDNYIVKIADFGLARDIRHDYYYRQKTKGKLPVKWMAPETLIQKRYTTQSDVWSFGVLLWEIVSFGSVPYMAYDDAEKLLEDIQSGYRMKKPSGCSTMTYSVMCKCWNYLPEDRPKFSEIIEDLKEILGDDAIIEIECPNSDCSDSDSSNSTISRNVKRNETDSLLEETC